ncbi:hypothetical protein QAD02_012083 [Eretmocerus hayati]|uniref:Uncharacterized protein n=1 Tax=Eretmocerus hayati TaxID=131215 RepID=A0ACC2NYQ4_9HYME|nr:hypothetical protein QAD02_012083 [Eretmocerus hayati]
MTSNNEQIDDVHSLIHSKDDSSTIIWTIYQPIRGKPHNSVDFFTGVNDEFTWYLRFSTFIVNRPGYSNDQFCKLELFLKDSKSVQPCKVGVDLCIQGCPNGTLNNFGRHLSVVQSTNAVAEVTVLASEVRTVYENPNASGGLNIHCRIRNYDSCVTPRFLTSDILGMHIAEPGLSKDFRKILESGKLCDIDLVVNKQKFHAHKIVLASRSPVFMAMFENDMQEKLSNEINIPDVDPDVMEKFLSYIYTNQVKNIESFAEGLIAAADKYQVDGLKTLASRAIVKKMNKENVIESLILADLHHVDELKKHALHFIARHMKNLKEIKGFNTLASTYPALLEDILIFMSERHV